MKVYAIIVTYNPDPNLLFQQYKSLENQLNGIVYVDNGSLNISEVEKLKDGRDNVYVLRNNQNQGLGKAQNQGVNFARSLNADYYIFFDHDSVPNDSFVNNLIEAHKALCKNGILVGAVGPSCLNSDSGSAFAIKKRSSSNYGNDQLLGIIEVEFLLSSGTLVSDEALRKIGLMNETFFVDYIDSEWCCRALSKGYKLFVNSSSVLVHKVGDKRIKFLNFNLAYHSPLRRYYLIRNNLLIFRLSYYPLRMKMTSLIKNLMRITIMLFYSSERLNHLKCFFYGFFDGIVGYSGEYRYFKVKSKQQ